MLHRSKKYDGNDIEWEVQETKERLKKKSNTRLSLNTSLQLSEQTVRTEEKLTTS